MQLFLKSSVRVYYLMSISEYEDDIQSPIRDWMLECEAERYISFIIIFAPI